MSQRCNGCCQRGSGCQVCPCWSCESSDATDCAGCFRFETGLAKSRYRKKTGKDGETCATCVSAHFPKVKSTMNTLNWMYCSAVRDRRITVNGFCDLYSQGEPCHDRYTRAELAALKRKSK